MDILIDIIIILQVIFLYVWIFVGIIKAAFSDSVRGIAPAPKLLKPSHMIEQEKRLKEEMYD